MQRVMAALPLIMKLPLVVAWSHLPAYSVIDPQVFERVEPLGGGRRMIQWVGVLPRPSWDLGYWTGMSWSDRRMCFRAKKPPCCIALKKAPCRCLPVGWLLLLPFLVLRVSQRSSLETKGAAFLSLREWVGEVAA